MTVSCNFCGLPVTAAAVPAADGPTSPVYCCFGCEFAAEVTQSNGRDGASRALLIRIALAAFCSMNVLAFTMVLWSHDVYGSASDQRALVLDGLLRYLGLMFSLPVWFLLGQPLLVSAVGRSRRGIPATDLLVCLGVLAAYGFSVVSTVRSAGPVYYEVACIVLLFITLGRWLEAQGKLQATAALDELEKLLPEVVSVQRGEAVIPTPLTAVCPGDRLAIRPGDCISVDGVIQSGTAHIDERLLTGESWPVARRPGDTVRAGAYNIDGQLSVLAMSTAVEGSLGRIVQGLRAARQQEGYYERLAERVTVWFLPLTIIVAIGATGWHGWHFGWQSGVMSGLAVLLIACPCALGLATPLAAWTAFSHAARHQVLFRNGEALERLAEVQAVAWDKTGTLTTPEPKVSSIIWSTAADRELRMSQFTELATHSRHPFSRALAGSSGRVKSTSILPAPTTDFIEIHELPGRGMVARSLAGEQVCVGNQQLMDEYKLTWEPRLCSAWKQLRTAGKSVVFGGSGGTVDCLFVIAETLRPGAADVAYQLQMMGIQQQVLTGDQAPRTAKLLEELFASRARRTAKAIDPAAHPILTGTFTYLAELRPEQKVEAVHRLQAKYGPVAMVGDGVNDALALTVAHVGVAMRSGADISRDSAAVCLFGDDIRRLPWAIDYARFTVKIIKQNLWWAFGYNTVGILIAASGYLNPSFAAVLMAGSSLFVMANTWRLSRRSPQQKKPLNNVPQPTSGLPCAVTGQRPFDPPKIIGPAREQRLDRTPSAALGPDLLQPVHFAGE